MLLWVNAGPRPGPGSRVRPAGPGPGPGPFAISGNFFKKTRSGKNDMSHFKTSAYFAFFEAFILILILIPHLEALDYSICLGG